ncbi:hypothetical protein [Herbiconiux sp.]|uniref:hypothetical protein n=1 Tax=Herbiconiux sp. TaxID=1871186 RepID=UPI0025BF08E9|nr:hypothetical protein [Herbiconiux sp.]
MAPALPLLLDQRSLPRPELVAVALDGEVRSLGDAYLPLDVVETPGLRAEAVRRLVPEGLILERRSAAWLLGAHPLFEIPLQLCVRSTRRIRFQPSAEHVVRQVVVSAGECVSIGGLVATAPLRTALDLVRWEEEFDGRLAVAVTTLLLAASTTPHQAARLLGASPHLPHKRRAFERLRMAGVLSRR